MTQTDLCFTAPTYKALSPQQQALLPLLMGGWVTVAESLTKAGIYALSQRCGELAKAGYRIEKTWRELPSGKSVRAYRIEP